MKVTASKTDPPLGAMLTCFKAGVSVEWGKDTSLTLTDTISISSSHGISRHIARVNPSLNLYPSHILHRTEVDHWLSTASGPLSCSGDIGATLDQLDKVLAPAAVLVGQHITVADLEVFAALYRNGSWKAQVNTNKAPTHVLRWYNAIEAQMSNCLNSLPEDVRQALIPATKTANQKQTSSQTASKPEEGGKFIELPDAKMGEVVVRFPPEASGYLHIGHAKAALLNQYYQLAFKGKLVLRFDDTNPAKEKEQFEKVILEDVDLLDIKPDIFTFTSDHFDFIMTNCEKLIHTGLAYCDDTDAETMKKEREERKESKNYTNTVEKNLSMWEEMKKGSVYGQTCCVRARIDMKSDNGCMRDPTIYRCKNEPHPRTGDKYKVYPTYDFACPIVDSTEGVTHALRTTEYHDRDDQFHWFIEKLRLRPLHILEYSRLNMNNTVLSKRKLTWFVDEGYVDGWDDPRFPTVRGILRRGMTVQGLKDFIVSQGFSRSVVNMEWDKIWAFNKKVIDPTAARYTALQGDMVPVNVSGVREEATVAQKHPKDPTIGSKTVWVAPRVFIEAVDAADLKEGENATFINWGNLMIKKVKKVGGKIESVDAEANLDNKDYKKTLKLTWLPDTPKTSHTPIVCVYFDHLITKGVLGKEEDFKDFIGQNTRAEVKMIGDEDLKSLKAGEIIQLQRKGFFRVDDQYQPASLSSCQERPVVLFSIPDGHTTNATASSVRNTASMSEKERSKSSQGKKAEKSPQEEAKPMVGQGSGADILNQIKVVGDKIRQMKIDKLDKNIIMVEVEILKKLKNDFKQVTNLEWKPDIVLPSSAPATSVPSPAAALGGQNVISVHNQIKEQGEKVRTMKGNKADKDAIKAAVDVLLELKKQFKNIANVDWKPEIDISQFSTTPGAPGPSPAAPLEGQGALDLHNKIMTQGEKVRALKASKADKDTIKAEVDILLALKKDFKNITNMDWKPDIVLPSSAPATSAPAPAVSAGGQNVISVHNQIKEQGEKVRTMKGNKADKDAVKAEVDILLAFKKDFKNITNVDWKPDIDITQFTVDAAPAVAATNSGAANVALDLHNKIKAQGDTVRTLKASKTEKDKIKVEVDILLALKTQFKEATGMDWKPEIDASQFSEAAPASGATPSAGAAAPAKSAGRNSKEKSPAKSTGRNSKEKSPNKSASKAPAKSDDTTKKQTRLGLEAKKEDNLPDWYSQVITKSEMIEYYNVSGCYILRPWSYVIWEFIKDFLDKKIKDLGVENSYFPIFVSRDALEKEKTHIADFSPEVAWVTKSGSSDMAEPLAIRPTSETVMYPAFAKWIQSHRDLPMRLNQWNNVVRWEFKQPTPFLRTREFLWQEGHTAFATRAEAEEEVYQILEFYAQVYEYLLAIPVVRGRKTEKEKFAGGDFTTTTEAFISASGRAIQGATSHHLGQNFSHMFEIVFEDPETKQKQYVYQNSWGLTTRTIGVLVMVHGDNKGLVLPPRVATLQAVIMPVGITAKTTDDEKANLIASCNALEQELKEAGVRVRNDLRDNVTPAWKFNHWELKGVPLRLEMGPREVAAGQVFAVRRDTGEKTAVSRATAGKDIGTLLDTIQASMYNKARLDLDTHKVLVNSWPEFTSALDKGNIMLAPFCGREECEDAIKKDSAREEAAEAGAPAMGAKGLCIPFEQPGDVAGLACIYPTCKTKPLYYTLFGRSY